jgi:tetratricopeptide (TPR) repeat protein
MRAACRVLLPALAALALAAPARAEDAAACANGALLYHAGRLDEAAEALDRCLAEGPLEPALAVASLNLRSQLHVRRGDFALAAEDAGAVIAIDPTQTAAYYNRAVAYLNLGEPARARADLDDAIALAPEAAALYLERGYAHSALGDLDRAIADFDRVIALGEHVALARVERGGALLRQGNLAGALADYDRALAIDPNLAEAYRRRSHALLQIGRLLPAIEDLQQAVRLAPDDAWSHNDLAWLLATQRPARLRIGGRAVGLAERAMALQPDSAAIADTLAAAFADAGRYADAVATQHHAIALAEAEAQSAEVLAEMRERLARYREGKPWRE